MRALGRVLTPATQLSIMQHKTSLGTHLLEGWQETRPAPNANGAVSIPGQFNSSAAAGQASANQSSTGQQNAYDQYAT